MKVLFYLFFVCSLCSCTKYFNGNGGTSNTSGYWKINGVQYNKIVCTKTVNSDNTGYLYAVDDTNKVRGEKSNSLFISFKQMPAQSGTYYIQNYTTQNTAYPAYNNYVYVRLVTGAAYDIFGPYGPSFEYQYLSASPVNNLDKLYVSVANGKIKIDFSNATMYKVNFILFNQSQLSETVKVEGSVTEN